jgi:hypothetical protein
MSAGAEPDDLCRLALLQSRLARIERSWVPGVPVSRPPLAAVDGAVVYDAGHLARP